MITKEEISKAIRTGQLAFPPLQLEIAEIKLSMPATENSLRLDAALRFRWQSCVYNFGVEIGTRYTPQALEQAIDAIVRRSRTQNIYPMIVMPYLNESALRQLERQAVSGLDLCGNGVIVVPNQLLVFRTGFPNQYPSSAPIKNVYRGDSSLAARVFLARAEYPSVNAIQAEIKRRGGDAALSTVSKVLNALEEDLLVGRNSGIIRLLQPEKLLEKLTVNYRPPKISRRFQAKYMADPTTVMETLVSNAGANHAQLILTGAASANLYAIMSRPEHVSLYCADVDALLSLREEERPSPVEETSRFADIELIQTEDKAVYFDRREADQEQLRDVWRAKDWLNILLYGAASPVQTYLELMASGPREKQTAEQVKQVILETVGQPKQ